MILLVAAALVGIVAAAALDPQEGGEQTAAGQTMEALERFTTAVKCWIYKKCRG